MSFYSKKGEKHELGVLGAKIEDQDALGMDICRHDGISGSVKIGELYMSLCA